MPHADVYIYGCQTFFLSFRLIPKKLMSSYAFIRYVFERNFVSFFDRVFLFAELGKIKYMTLCIYIISDVCIKTYYISIYKKIVKRCH